MALGGRKIVKLPYGYLEADKPVQDEAEIRAMTGVEEDVLSDDRLPMERRLAEVLVNCIERIGEVRDKGQIRTAVGKLSTEDQTALLVGLRSISVGNMYAYVVDCPSCETLIEFSVDLDSLGLRPSEAKGKGWVEIALPSGKKAKIRPLLLDDAAKLEEVRAKGTDAITSLAIWARMVELDGKPAPTLEDVRGMLYADRVYLRNVFGTVEGGVEDEYSVTCDKCGKPFSCYLDIARVEFFAPKNAPPAKEAPAVS